MIARRRMAIPTGPAAQRPSEAGPGGRGAAAADGGNGVRGGDESVEEGTWFDAAEAVAWGRRRAPKVYLRVHQPVHQHRFVRAGDILVRLRADRPHDRYVLYSAGEV